MERTNMKRVLMGGLLAGLVINVSEFVLNTFVVGDPMAAQMTKLGLPMIGVSQIAIFILFGFGEGLILAWLYAAVRPRLGPGSATATKIGILVWFLATLSGGVSMAITGLMPVSMMMVIIAWGLVELIVAANAGAYFYRE
jgi:hypothetical protein